MTLKGDVKFKFHISLYLFGTSSECIVLKLFVQIRSWHYLSSPTVTEQKLQLRLRFCDKTLPVKIMSGMVVVSHCGVLLLINDLDIEAANKNYATL